jgi:hypothetical protein
MTKKQTKQWSHPTGKTPRSIHVICSGFTQRDYIAMRTAYDPVVADVDEVWSLNKALRSIKCDLGFVLDDLVGEHNRSRRYMADIRKVSESIPIITTTIDSPVQALTERSSAFHEFPIIPIRDKLGIEFAEKYTGRSGRDFNEADCRVFGNDLLYFRNSVPMILAYALFIGVHTVYLWGADYSHPGSGARLEADQPNAEYWVGFCKAHGMQIVLPGGTTLLSTDKGTDLYGYGARQPFLGV